MFSGEQREFYWACASLLYLGETARARSFLFAFVVVFTLGQHTKEEARANHVAARDLFIALSIDMVFTLPFSLFIIHVIAPKLIASMAIAEDHMKSLTARFSMSERPSSLPNDLARDGNSTPNISPLWEADSERGSRASAGTAPPSNESCAGRWTQSFDHETGRVYYFDSFTGRSQWEPPPDFEGVWQEVTDEQGQTYYHNTQTGETSWHRPSVSATDRASLSQLDTTDRSRDRTLE